MAEHPLSERLEDLHKRREQAFQPGSERSVQRQHDRGKMLARERIEYLLDEGSFHELDLLARSRNPDTDERPYTDGVITGWGTVDGRKVFVFSQDFTLFGGALGEVFAEKIHKLMDLSLKVGAPLVGLNDGAGARIQEGPVSLASYGGIFYRNVKASGVTPQISVIMGPCAGGAVYSPAMTDFVFMVDQTVVHVHHRSRCGEDGDRSGGHPAGAGRRDDPCLEVGHRLVHRRRTTRPAWTTCATCSAFLPSNNLEVAPTVATDDPSDRKCPELSTLMPDSANVPYDMRKVVTTIVDDGDFFEYFPHWAQNIVCGFARLGGESVGHRRQPAHVLRRRARHRVVGEGGAVRPYLRCVQHPADHVRGRAGVPARVSIRSTTASSATAPSCCTPTARRPCPASRSSPARPTAARSW